ncbi:hypothetical protein ACIBCH_17295 [Amycolatopsis thailandensis]|uniref:hypothetical protein n=1 Tax=Amycolatopsis thailandensis TaxID=589330 RepID=UPI003799DA82
MSSTSEDLPEPDLPVNTVSSRLGTSRQTSWRLLVWAQVTVIALPEAESAETIIERYGMP